MPTIGGFSFSLANANLVHETTQTPGTGTYSLDGAATDKRTFVAGFGSGQRCYYTARLGANWEEGLGTITSGAPATISRDLIIKSSNSNNAVNWGAGTKDIYVEIGSGLADQIWPQPTLPIKRSSVTLSGSTSTIASINAGTREIVVGINGMGTNGNNLPAMLLGDSGGLEATATYFSGITAIATGASPIAGGNPVGVGFPMSPTWVANDSRLTGVLRLVNMPVGTNTWLLAGLLGNSTAGPPIGFVAQMIGLKTLSSVLTQVALTTADTWNAGAWSIQELP